MVICEFLVICGAMTMMMFIPVVLAIAGMLSVRIGVSFYSLLVVTGLWYWLLYKAEAIGEYARSAVQR